MTEKASRESWVITPFSDVLSVPYREEFCSKEFEAIKMGFVPTNMNEKWFLYYEECTLFIHRSWTGLPYYRVHFDLIGGGARVSKAFLSTRNKYGEIAQEVKNIRFLIHNVLLGRSPFLI